MRRKRVLQFRAGTAVAGASSTITQGAVTLTFNSAANYVTNFQGENFIQTGVTLNSYTPAPTGTGSTARNGAMVNPTAANQQGWDGRISGVDANNQITYSDSYNKGLNLPWTPANGDSLIVAVSRNPSDNFAALGANPQAISSYEVFTFVDTLPSSTTIRPPWAGTWKPLYTQADVNTGLLGVETTETDPSTYGAFYNGLGYPWSFNFNDPQYAITRFFDPMPGYLSFTDLETTAPSAIIQTGLQPEASQFFYPKNWGCTIGQHMLYTMCNFTNRNTIAYNLVKIGIDYMSHHLLGWQRAHGAGFAGSRKSPAIYAGKLLGNPSVNGTAWLTRLASKGNVADGTRGFPYSDFAQMMFPEEQGWYYTSSPYSGYSYPTGINPRSPTPSGWPGGYPLFGDNRAGTGSNHSNRDPAGKYNGIGGVNSTAGDPGYYADLGSRYQATDNADGVTGNQNMKTAGAYLFDAMRGGYISGVLANRMLGVESTYNNQAFLDFVDWWMADDTLACPVYETSSAFRLDIQRGGSGNGFVTSMWTKNR